MKIGDLVVATRKQPHYKEGWENRYLGIFIKDEYGDKYVECIGGEITARFSPDFWDVEVVNENW